jgi:iron complex transport system ATP-binding protein
VGHVALHGVRVAAGTRTLFENISFEVAPAEFVAIVGPNGAGKTTLLRTIAGFIRPLAGEVTIDGAAVHRLSARERALGVTLLGSESELPYGTSVRDVVATGRFAHRDWWEWGERESDARIVEDALRHVDLAECAERPFETLSSGERQRARIALALAQEASLVLVDEPTSHLDPRFAHEILSLLRSLAQGPRSVVAVLHDLSQAAAADRVLIVADGELLADGPPRGALEPSILERAYHIAFSRFEQDGVLTVVPRGPLVAGRSDDARIARGSAQGMDVAGKDPAGTAPVGTGHDANADRILRAGLIPGVSDAGFTGDNDGRGTGPR